MDSVAEEEVVDTTLSPSLTPGDNNLDNPSQAANQNLPTADTNTNPENTQPPTSVQSPHTARNLTNELSTEAAQGEHNTVARISRRTNPDTGQTTKPTAHPEDDPDNSPGGDSIGGNSDSSSSSDSDNQSGSSPLAISRRKKVVISGVVSKESQGAQSKPKNSKNTTHHFYRDKDGNKKIYVGTSYRGRKSGGTKSSSRETSALLSRLENMSNDQEDNHKFQLESGSEEAGGGVDGGEGGGG